MSDLFQVLPQEKMQKVIRDFLPRGRAWDKKSDNQSNIYKLLLALAVVYIQDQEVIRWLSTEADINQTNDLIAEWEESVGLPDECISNLTALDKRREAVISRIRKVPYVDKEQIQQLVQFFFPAFIVTIYPKADLVPTPTTADRFTLVVGLNLIEGNEFEYTFEHPFSSSVNPDEIVCLLRKIVPANVFIEVNFEG